jgi:hypothetical protein
MSDLTAYVIEMLGAELCVRDWQEQEQLFRDLGVQIHKWNTDGVCDIDADKLINWVCEYLVPVEGGGFLRAVCNDIEWHEVEAFVKAEVDDWWSSRPEPEDEPTNKKRRLE